MRRPRAWRITMWTSLAATVLLAGGAIATRGWQVYWFDGQSGCVGLSNSAFWCARLNLSLRERGWKTEQRYLSPQFPQPLWWHFSAKSGWSFGLSLWIPAGATFAMSSLCAVMVYRRRRPGHCPNCGYDRSGLPTDAPCPECGKERKT